MPVQNRSGNLLNAPRIYACYYSSFQFMWFGSSFQYILSFLLNNNYMKPNKIATIFSVRLFSKIRIFFILISLFINQSIPKWHVNISVTTVRCGRTCGKFKEGWLIQLSPREANIPATPLTNLFIMTVIMLLVFLHIIVAFDYILLVTHYITSVTTFIIVAFYLSKVGWNTFHYCFLANFTNILL